MVVKLADLKATQDALRKAAQSTDDTEREDARRLLGMLGETVRDANVETAREALEWATGQDGNAALWTYAIRQYRAWTGASLADAKYMIGAAMVDVMRDAAAATA